ncbi:MAG: acyltransferase [Bacteroidales bacterium]|nr:acyltransferase [Bacteroidales bacterium]
MEKRIAFIDYIRVIACFLVMLVHASENFYSASASGLAGNASMLVNEANRFWVAFYDGGIARICVPLFMIVSAFLLVPMKKGVSMAEFYKKRFTRILPPMIFFLLLYTFLPLLWGQMSWEQSWTDFKMLPFTFPSMAGHLWFMYPLISLYLIIPIVSPWLEKASAKDERIFLYIFALTTFAPFFTRFVSADLWGMCFWNPYFGMFYYCSGYLGYLVLAHYIRVHLNWDRAKKIRIGALCLAAGAFFTGWSFWHTGVPGKLIDTPMLEWAWEFCTPNVLCATFGAFLLFTCIRREEAPKAVTAIAKLSFGMYLAHMFFMSNIAPVFVTSDPANPLVPVWLAIPCIAALTFICSFVTAWLLSKLPGSKWLIGA